MEKDGSQCLRCYIHKFPCQIELSEISEICVHLRYRCLALRLSGNTINILKIGHGARSRDQQILTLQSIREFHWINDVKQTLVKDQGSARFVAISVNQEILTGAVSDSTLTTDATQLISEISNISEKGISSEDCSDVKLIAACGRYVLVTTQYHVVCLRIGDGSFHVISTIQLPSSCQDVKQFVKVARGVVIFFDREQNRVSFHDIETGNLSCRVDLQKTNIESDRLLEWQISDDLQSLMVLENTLSLTVINLEKYSQENPLCVEISTTNESGPVSPCHTCYTGDTVWRNKLTTLHDRHSEVKTVPWYQVKRDQTPSVKKYKWKISGFRRKNAEMKDSSTVLMGKVFLPPSLQSMKISDTSMSTSVVSLAFQSDRESALVVWEPNTSSLVVERLCSQSQVILSTDPGFPHMIAMPTHLVCVVMNKGVQQEDFVSKMMVYAGASVAETLCHINKWGRCSLPIHTLEIGLKQRQLDTVVFFLKSKENFFSNAKKTNVSSPNSPGITSPTWSLTSNHHDNLNQLEPALQLLIDTIQQNVSKQESLRFSKKLAEILLDFLYGLLHDGLNLLDNTEDTYGHENEEKYLNQAIEKLLDLIGLVRSSIRQVRDSDIQKTTVNVVRNQERVPVPGTPAEEWAKMDLKQVIESGVQENKIPVLQTYLRENGRKADFSTVTDASLDRAVQYLSQRQIKPAILIIANLGLDVDDKLWEITLLCKSKQMRDFIIEELKTRAPLKQEQNDLVTYADSLAKCYPCPSFKEAVISVETQIGERPQQRDLCVQLTNRRYDLTEECGEVTDMKDMAVQSPDSMTSQSARYSQILLDWLQSWDTDTQQLVLLDAEIAGKDWMDQLKCRLDLVVDYLARYNQLDKLKMLIDQAVTSDDHTIVQEIHSQANKMTAHSFLEINLYCTQKRLYMNASDFTSLLSQMRYVGGPLSSPHPLTGYPVRVQEMFHQDFTQYCVQHDLPSLLWQYCFVHSISPDTLSCVLDRSADHKWLAVFVHLYSVAINPHNTISLYEASLANATLIWSLENSVVPALINKGEVLTALATLLYSPFTLQQITPGTDVSHIFGDLTTETLEQALLPYPKIHSALFPASAIDKHQNDVTVYQLLKDNAPFSPCRLFGWQSMNRVKGEDAPKQLPHFSLQDLVNRFAYSEKLRYTYYLKQGRPSFAFASFLAEELDADPTNISSKSIMAACGTALWIGIKNFYNPQISCACVVFTEMLGQNSILIRTYLQVGQEILLHLNGCLTGNIDKRKEKARSNEIEIASWLCGCVLQPRKQPHFILSKLEEAISASLNKNGIPSTSFEAGQKWTIAVLYCQMLHLQLTNKFLEQCAKANKWLPFLWFAQTHQYPKEQLHSLLYKFKSVHLQQHLHYVIENAETKASDVEQTATGGQGQSSNKGKDVRSSLYSRIGLKKDTDSNELSSSDEEDQQQMTSVPSVDDSDDGVMLVDFDSAPDDVFRVVFVTQTSKSQWRSLLQYSIVLRNPLFAELAACIKDASVLPCMCGWLVAMMDQKEHDRFLKIHGKFAGKWSMRHLSSIIDIYLQNNWVSTLATGFHIFQPDSPIIAFLKFSAEFSERRNFSHCKVLLEDFKESFHLYCHDITPEERQSILGDTDWFQQLAYRILQYLFCHTDSVYDILQLLKLLDSQSIVLIFKFEVPDFSRLARLVQMIVNIPIPAVNFSMLVSNDVSDFNKECQNVLDVMVDKKQFRQAREFSREAGLSQDPITMAEIKDNKSRLELSPLWQSAITRRRFWKECADSFHKYKLSVEKATDFFQAEADTVDSYREKAYLYQLCVWHMEIYPRSDILENLEHTYHTMSVYRIRAKMEQMQSAEGGDDFMEDIYGDDTRLPMDIHDPKKELLNFGKMPHKGETSKDLTEQERKALDLLIQELLDSGHVVESCRLASDFNFYSQDLAIVLTCIRLALGAVTVGENMDLDMVSLLAESTGHRRLSMASTPSLGRITSKASMISLASVASSAWDFLPVDQEKNIVTMEALLDNCHHGNQCCKQVINCYVIATVLNKGYEDVVLDKEFNVLKELLKTDMPQRFWLASEFLGSSSLKNSEVAGFLCDAIVDAYKYTSNSEELMGIHGNHTHTKEDKDLLFDPTEDGSVASQFVTLCPDPSLLGDRLLDVVTAMSGEHLISTALLSVQTELLILAHTCHTTACNMEGISNVLRSARVITVSLANTQNFSLMVRLLTGVGRFSEMPYIFDSLKVNEHFELLLKKGIEKENSLKIALLDYLKRYHPSDIDTYDMVAHNFIMHREIAQMLETRAQKGLHKYKDKLLENTSEIKTDLQNIVQDFNEAAESYYKESCIRHAQTCLRHARLVALQLQHLSPVTTVLHLSSKGAEKFIATHPKFLEALIVSETYGKKGSWPDALCHNVLVAGDFRYLTDFKSHIKLTTSLASETIDKFQKLPNNTSQSLNNLKKFLEHHCRDVKLKYKVAKEYGFRDLMASMEKGDSSSYVQDLVHIMT